MKRKFILFTATAGIAALVLSSYSGGPAANGQGNRTGSAGNATCGGGGCHGSTNANLLVSVGLVDPSAPTTPVSKYTPGKTYTVTLGGNNSAGGHPKFGFQCTAVRASSTSTAAGTFATGSTTGIAVRTNVTPALVENSTAINGITAGTQNAYLVQFNWTAPAAGTGAVRFYAILNSVNGNGNADASDGSNSTMTEIPENTTAVPQLAADVRISTYPNPATGMLNVKLEGIATGAAKLLLMDASGKAVAHQEVPVAAGNGAACFDVSGLAKGVYLLDVTVGGAHRTQRVSVQ